MVAEVLVDHAAITIDRIVAAVDCGVAINPDIVTAQIEGAIGFVLSAALLNQVTLNKGVAEQSNFEDYVPARIREILKWKYTLGNRQLRRPASASRVCHHWRRRSVTPSSQQPENG